VTENWKHQITIEVDETMLGRVTDKTLALWWHVVQANPADGHTNPAPGNLAEKVGREIIRRWLKGIEPDLWHHQGRHYYWHTAGSVGNWRGPGQSFVPFEPLADPHIVMRALADAAVFARKTAGDSETADQYEQLLRQLQEQEKSASA
jgi:hypothetical protein